MTHIYVILYNNICIFRHSNTYLRNTHFAPQHFAPKYDQHDILMYVSTYILACILSPNNTCTCQGGLLKLTFPRLIVPLIYTAHTLQPIPVATLLGHHLDSLLHQACTTNSNIHPDLFALLLFPNTSHIAQKCKNFFKMTDNSKKDSLWQQPPVTAPRCAAFYLVSLWLQKSIFPLCLQQFSKYLGQILCVRRADLAAPRQQFP